MTRKKRVRTTSPSSTPKGDYELRRKRREKEKRERHERERQVRKEAREAQFLQEIIAEAPEEDYAMHGKTNSHALNLIHYPRLPFIRQSKSEHLL